MTPEPTGRLRSAPEGFPFIAVELVIGDTLVWAGLDGLWRNEDEVRDWPLVAQGGDQT